MADESNGPNSISSPSRAYSGQAYDIYIDVNGIKPPNTMGKDLFLVMLDTKGSVIPFGSFLHRDYVGSGGATLSAWDVLCPNKTSPNDPPADPATCTGSIVDNGGRVLYNYEAITTKVKENGATPQPY